MTSEIIIFSKGIGCPRRDGFHSFGVELLLRFTETGLEDHCIRANGLLYPCPSKIAEAIQEAQERA